MLASIEFLWRAIYDRPIRKTEQNQNIPEMPPTHTNVWVTFNDSKRQPTIEILEQGPSPPTLAAPPRQVTGLQGYGLTRHSKLVIVGLALSTLFVCLRTIYRITEVRYHASRRVDICLYVTLLVGRSTRLGFISRSIPLLPMSCVSPVKRAAQHCL